MAAPASRRERMRAATTREIRDTARRHLVEFGPSGVALRGIAREMGMTAPGLYRYYASLDDLLTALIVELYGELTATLEQARDAVPAEDLGERLRAASRAFRGWSVSHPAEFALLFGSPVPGYAATPQDTHEAGLRFGGVFLDLFADLWSRQPFPVPADDQLDAGLSRQLAVFAEGVGVDLPVGAVEVWLSCWARLYGLICLEVFGHLRFALEDVTPMFEAELADLARVLGLTGTHPAGSVVAGEPARAHPDVGGPPGPVPDL